MTNEVLHDKMKKDGNEHYLNLLKMAYHWSNNEAQKEHKLGKHAKKPAAKEVHGQEEVILPDKVEKQEAPPLCSWRTVTTVAGVLPLPLFDQRRPSPERRRCHPETRHRGGRFGDLMQGTFGPQGLDKMLYKTNGETASLQRRCKNRRRTPRQAPGRQSLRPIG